MQRSRLDVWRHFLQPAGVSPSLKSVDNTLLLIQMVAARMGIAALPHWVVESFERQGLVVTKTLGEGLWSRLYAAVRDGEQRQPITEAFIRSARNHACDHLPFVKRGATHLRCTHSEARITSAPVINVGQCGCWCQIARFTSSPAGTCILFIMPSVPASTCVAP